MSRAVLYLLIATSLFSVINLGVKVLPLPASEIVVFRAGISFLLCLWFLKRKKVPLAGKNKGVLFLRGLFGTLALFGIFLILQKIPLAIAMTLINLTPILTVVIAHFVLKEKASPIQWALLLLAFAAVPLIRGGLEPVPFIWILVGLLSALGASIAYTCVRVLRVSEDPLVVILYFPLVTLPLIGPVAASQWQTPVGHQWWLLLGIGLLTQMAQYFMTLAYQLEKASKIMIFNYTGLLWGIVFGELFFEEHLTRQQYLGIGIVFACLCINYYVSLKKPLNPLENKDPV